MARKVAPRLSDLSHGGGCGCKIAPSLLQEIIQRSSYILPPHVSQSLLAGSEHSDDAAVYRLNDEQALVATTDFFMPIVDDPYDFGRIAATNALSDVYAMGGKPVMALAIVGMPIAKMSPEVIGSVLQGGADVCRSAGIPLAGGHSIDTLEPIYGLVALGLVHPQNIKRNGGAQPGDRLLLGKALGVGVLSAALKKGLLSAHDYAAMLDSTTKLNSLGGELAQVESVHAMTDVTGFGLAGHLLEMLRAAHMGAQVEVSRLPLLPAVQAHIEAGIVTGASARNWQSYGQDVYLPASSPSWWRDLLSDPQTSGGLLLAVDPQQADEVLDVFKTNGFAQARDIGVVLSANDGQAVIYC